MTPCRWYRCWEQRYEEARIVQPREMASSRSLRLVSRCRRTEKMLLLLTAAAREGAGDI